ncbi:hypothetical protein C8N32_11641 [Rhodovulum imhoffii]|uniref:Fe-S protein YdhL (DUF1289 family) n=1 Tax=Rhodovulum imhoffii TaxID=365340 RepID=A0A2T5BPZ8_9RHOB|nr:DUF1289 domain-containing protein [Rhodovulum imhoffii]MBK5933961.1 DUF1289 domain-containing protein [Rhodovulum imhoffii]PTN01168.1 hypothetical protein C8N32_11641 [Rhodovulum imhoffii]
MTAPLTPCIDICKIDRESRLCEGCYRSIDEIAAWSRLSNAERADIMATLPARAVRIANA